MTRDEVLKEYEYTRIDTDLIALECEPYTAWREDLMADEIVRLRQALKHETQWADAGIDSTAFWQQQRDELLHELSLSRLANEEQDKRLAAVEAERDVLVERLYHTNELNAEYVGSNRRLSRILAALREPNEAVVIAAEDAMDRASATDCVPGDWNTAWVLEAIRAAVTAAEKEVEGE